MKTRLSHSWFVSDETMKRLTILPDKMMDEMKNVITALFKNEIKELDSKTANEILVKSSPKDSKVRALQVQQQGRFAFDQEQTWCIVRNRLESKR